MEVIGINKTDIELEQFYEIYNAVFPKVVKKRLLKLGLAVTVLGILIGIFLKIRSQNFILSLPLVFAGILILTMGFRLEKKEAKKKYYILLTNNGMEEEYHREIEFYEDHFEIIEQGENRIITYEEIKEIKVTENYILFQLEDKKTVFFSKNGFINGNWKDIQTQILQYQLEMEQHNEKV